MAYRTDLNIVVLNIEQTGTCSSLGNRTSTPYFLLRTIDHRTSNIVQPITIVLEARKLLFDSIILLWPNSKKNHFKIAQKFPILPVLMNFKLQFLIFFSKLKNVSFTFIKFSQPSDLGYLVLNVKVLCKLPLFGPESRTLLDTINRLIYSYDCKIRLDLNRSVLYHDILSI